MKFQPFWTPEKDEQLKHLRSLGMHWSGVGARMGLSRDSVQQRYALLTKAPKPPKPVPEYLALKIEDYLGRIAKLNNYRVDDLKRRCYGWK